MAEVVEFRGVKILDGDVTTDYINGLSPEERRRSVHAHKQFMKLIKKRYGAFAKRDVACAELLKRNLNVASSFIALMEKPSEKTEQANREATAKLNSLLDSLGVADTSKEAGHA